MNATFFPWKERSFVQISSAIQKNKNDITNFGEMFKALPLKIYRREIANTPITNCNSRISLKLDNMNIPNGSILYSFNNGIETSINNEMIKPNNQSNEVFCLKDCLNTQNNALKRVRSSGIIKRKFDENNNTYYTNTNQYLTSRNKTFARNQYNYVRIGDPTLIPGSNDSISNIYSSNGVNFCKKYKILNALQNNVFSYRWLDGTVNSIVIPDGSYDIDSLNNLFQSFMTNNTHYYESTQTINKIYLLNIVYDIKTGKIQLQCYSSNIVTSDYKPASYSWSTYNSQRYDGYYSQYIPVAFIIPDAFTPVIGFSNGTYQAANNTSNASFLSNTSYGLAPLYRPISYKPNNYKFSQQGAVSSTALIARKKYDNVNTIAATYKQNYGTTSNILAYRVPFIGYSIKDKLGYPTTKTPIIDKNGLVKCEYLFRVKR